jgi:DnaK suppressor protein
MISNELNRFKAILTARVAELERFVHHRDGITVETSADQVEDIQRSSERALAASNLDREFKQLRNVRAALNRIQQGSFGVCQQCEEDIHPKRLAAVPWAQYCIRCQEMADRRPEEQGMFASDFLAKAA